MAFRRFRDVARALFILVPLLGLSLTGCGGGGGGGGGPAVTVSVSPSTSSVPVQGSEAFTATVGNASNRAVAWAVQEGAAGGSITQAGLYSAPSVAGAYHVVATSLADASKSATASVAVHTVVTVSPATATVLAGHTQAFTATVVGSPNTAVTWQVVEGTFGGSIGVDGVYTAPSAPGLYHVTATSQVDSVVSPQAAVTVQGGNVQGTIQ